MNDRAAASSLLLNIAAVERDTRIGKDTLRAWERRYGFPQPQRDRHDERLYPPEQVERLRVIKRLLDAGHRPGRVVALELDELQRLGGPVGGATVRRGNAGMAYDLAADAPDSETAQLVQILRSHEPSHLRRALRQSLLRVGLARFVTDVAVPLVQAVGQIWARGELQIFEEHLCSEVLENTLRAALASVPEPTPLSAPRVLLSTFPGETHSLALVMAEALFSVESCACMNLGRQTPLQDLALAARACRADIVALSFSAAGQPGQVADALGELRTLLPASVEIWAGCPHAALHRRGLDGVLLLGGLGQITEQVGRWRQGRA